MLNHPNICALYNVSRERLSANEAPVDFLAMEYVEDGTLAARLTPKHRAHGLLSCRTGSKN